MQFNDDLCIIYKPTCNNYKRRRFFVVRFFSPIVWDVMHPNQPFSATQSETRDISREEGITCASCHLEECKMVEPLTPTGILAPHPVRVDDDRYRNSQFCSRCHEGTFKEWSDVKAENKPTCHAKEPDAKQCTSCHKQQSYYGLYLDWQKSITHGLKSSLQWEALLWPVFYMSPGLEHGWLKKRINRAIRKYPRIFTSSQTQSACISLAQRALSWIKVKRPYWRFLPAINRIMNIYAN